LSARSKRGESVSFVRSRNNRERVKVCRDEHTASGCENVGKPVAYEVEGGCQPEPEKKKEERIEPDTTMHCSACDPSTQKWKRK
jgi:hypothetical protein